MIGLVIIAFVLIYWFASWRGYNKGIKVSGHICKSVDRGLRYKPEVMKLVVVYCKDCHELIPSELKVIERTHLPFPWTAEISDVDYKLHQQVYHGKEEE